MLIRVLQWCDDSCVLFPTHSCLLPPMQEGTADRMDLLFVNSTLLKNTAEDGGGIHLQGSPVHSEFRGMNIVDNNAARFGGALVSIDAGNLSIDGGIFRKNTGGDAGGAVYIQVGSRQDSL